MIRNGTERIIDHSPLNIFFTCKQIYLEAMPMLESRMIAKVRLSGSVANTFNPNHQFCQVICGLGTRGYGMGLGFPGRGYTVAGQQLRKVAFPINLLRYEGHNCFVHMLDVWMPNLELFLVYEIAATGFDADAVRLPSRAFSSQAEEEELWDVAVKRILFSPAHLTHTGINILHRLATLHRNWDLVIEQHISPRKVCLAEDHEFHVGVVLIRVLDYACEDSAEFGCRYHLPGCQAQIGSSTDVP